MDFFLKGVLALNYFAIFVKKLLPSFSSSTVHTDTISATTTNWKQKNCKNSKNVTYILKSTTKIAKISTTHIKFKPKFHNKSELAVGFKYSSIN